MNNKKIVIFGPPGAGKGTQSDRIISDFNVTHLSTGDVIRNHIKKETPLGLKVKGIMESGRLVDDRDMFDLVTQELDGMDESKGYLLDGFPRTLKQAEFLDSHPKYKPEIIIVLDKPRDEEFRNRLKERLTGRRKDPETGKTYNIYTAPKPPEEIIDRLEHRKDDTPESVEVRFETYDSDTKPELEYYEAHDPNRLIFVNPLQDIEKVYAEIKEKITNFSNE